MIKYRVKKKEEDIIHRKHGFFGLLWGYFSYKDIKIMESVSFLTKEEAFHYLDNVEE